MGAPNSSTQAIGVAGMMANNGMAKVVKTFAVTLSTLSDAAQFHWAPGFAGHISKVTWVTHTPASTASKLSTITPSIAGTNVTGGVLALTTAAANTRDKELAGTTVTANNYFTATQTITLTASSTTAFVEGSGEIQMEVVNDELLEALGLALGGLRYDA